MTSSARPGGTRQSALFLVDTERYEEARPLIGRMLAESPDDVQLLGAMVRCARGLGDNENALLYSELMVAAEPTGEWGHRLLALSLNRLGRRTEALEQARQARTLAPNAWEPYQAVALIAVDMLGHRKEATQAAEDCVRLAPDVPETHLTQGIVAQRRVRLTQAQECYRRALALDPQHEDAMRRLAKLEAENNWVQGANLRTRLLGMDPGDRATAKKVHHVLRGVRIFVAFDVVLALFCCVYGVTFPNADAVNVLETTGLTILICVVPLTFQIARLDPRTRRLLLLGANTRTRVGSVLAGLSLAVALAACAVPEAVRWILVRVGGPTYAALGPLTGGGSVRMTIERAAVGLVAAALMVLVQLGVRRTS